MRRMRVCLLRVEDVACLKRRGLTASAKASASLAGALRAKAEARAYSAVYRTSYAMRYRTSVSSSICIDPRSAFEIGQPASACLATAANSLLSIP